jgi:uncharacterized membrane protein
MNNVLSEIGSPVLDFIGIGAAFILTVAVFFGVKDKKYTWLHYLLLASVVGECLIVAIFHDGLGIRAFAVIILISVILFKLFISRRRKLAG